MKFDISRQLKRNLMLATAALAICPAGGALAATVDTAATDNGGLTEILVTATKRSEPLQKVPIAISVITGDQMLANNLNSLRDVISEIPSFNFRQAASFKDQALFIRGLGTSSTSPGVQPSVSTVIDGVVMGRQGQASLDLMNIDHIEVLRGPQGTLFGMNSSAGAVNIITKVPTEDFKGYIDAAYYEGNELRLRAGLSGPVVANKVLANVDAFVGHYDGNVTNVYNGDKVNGYDNRGGRTKWLFLLSDNVKFQLSADYTHSYNNSPNGIVSSTTSIAYPTNVVTQHAAYLASIAPAQVSADSRQVNINFPTYAVDTNWGVSGELDAALGDFSLTSITAYRDWRNKQNQDQDRLSQAFAGIPQMHDQGWLDYHQLSEELRLASPKNQMIDYVVGLFYFDGKDSEVYRRDDAIVSGANTTTPFGVSSYGVTNKNYAAFGESNVHFTDKFRALLGARVTGEKISYNFTRVSPGVFSGIQAPFAPYSESTSHTGFSGRAGLQYDLTDKALAYATYSRGYKGPAYNPAFSMLTQDEHAIKSETSNDFEIGVKSKWLDDRLLFNVAGFLDKVKNYQVSFFDLYQGVTVTRLVNAGTVSMRGIEGDLTARPIKNFTISGAFAYLNAHVDHFNCPPGASVSCDVDGQPLPFAPKWKGNIHADYTYAVTSKYDLVLSTDVNWQSSVQYSINQTPTTIQPAYAIWNANLSLVSNDGLKLAFLVRNITNKSYSTYLQTFGNGVERFVPRDDQRYVGFDIRKDF